MKPISNKQIESSIDKNLDKIESKIDIISKTIGERELYKLIKGSLLEEITDKEFTYLNYSKLANALFDMIFTKEISTDAIINSPTHLYYIIKESLIEGKYLNYDNEYHLKTWMQTKLLPNIHKKIVELGTKNDLLELIDKAISFHIDVDEEVQFLNTELLGDILYHLIFENNLSLKEISQEETVISIIDSSLIAGNENKMKDELFMANTTRWLRYHAIPYIYEHKKEYEPEQVKVKTSERLISKGFIETPKREKESLYESIPELKPIELTINEQSKLYERISTIVRSFYDSFYNESSLCSYYTYYFLKLKGRLDFDFEFRQLEDKLYIDFYNYGIFAIIGELRHFIGQFIFKEDMNKYSSIELSNYIDYPTHENPQFRFRTGFSKSAKSISECVGIDIEDIYKIIKIEMIYHHTNQRYYKSTKQIPIKEQDTIRDIEFLYLIEKYFGYLTRPEFILKIAHKSFHITEENEPRCYWSEQYGGEAWASITKTMLSRNFITSKTIFVDTCWSLQHNTELFLDKVFDGNISKLKSYLSEIKDGIFKNIYECAIKYNPKLDRYLYRNLVLENDAIIPDAQYEIEPEPQHGRFNYEKSEAYVDITNRPEREKILIYKDLDENSD